LLLAPGSIMQYLPQILVKPRCIINEGALHDDF
jgi:hypothetical protein